MSDDQFNQLTKQIADVGDQILKLYQHMEQRFGELETKVDAKADDSKVDKMLGLLDAMAKQQETEQHERLAMNHQLTDTLAPPGGR